MSAKFNIEAINRAKKMREEAERQRKMENSLLEILNKQTESWN